jgi:hypothetical protein
LVFLIGGIGSCIISGIFRLGALAMLLGILLALSAIVLVILGIFLILIAEILMRKKGLLNYV